QANDINGLAVIAQMQPLTVVFTVPQDEIFRVRKQQIQGKEGLLAEAYNRDFGQKLATGSLEAIDNQVDPATGTVRLKSDFDNKDGRLFPNQFVNAKLLVETLHDVVLVPSAAVQIGPESTYVYVVKPDNTVELRTVVAGAADQNRTAIDEGLTEGEFVV